MTNPANEREISQPETREQTIAMAAIPAQSTQPNNEAEVLEQRVNEPKPPDYLRLVPDHSQEDEQPTVYSPLAAKRIEDFTAINSRRFGGYVPIRVTDSRGFERTEQRPSVQLQAMIDLYGRFADDLTTTEFMEMRSLVYGSNGPFAKEAWKIQTRQLTREEESGGWTMNVQRSPEEYEQARQNLEEKKQAMLVRALTVRADELRGTRQYVLVEKKE